MTLQPFRVALALLAASLAAAEDAGKWKPGLQQKVPTSEGFDIDVFIPNAYPEQAARRFPVLFMHSWDGKPQLAPFKGWADKNSVILIGVNGAENGPNEPIVKRQEAAIAFVEKELRISNALRFSKGMSGAAMMSWLLCINHKDKHAGILLMGQSGFPDNLPPKHVAVAYIHGDKDQNATFIEMVYKMLKKSGNPLRRLVKPGGHIEGEQAEQEEMLSWMVNLERFTHPGRSVDEIKEAKEDALKRIAGLDAIADAAARLVEAELLFLIPGVEKWPEAKALALSWYKAAVEKAGAMSTPIDKHDLLTEVSQSPRLKQVPPAECKALPGMLAELRKDPAVKKEFEAGQMLQRVASAESTAKSKGEWQQVLEGYKMVQARFAGTKAADRAEEGIKRANAGVEKR
jgi:predicted esterase